MHVHDLKQSHHSDSFLTWERSHFSTQTFREGKTGRAETSAVVKCHVIFSEVFVSTVDAVTQECYMETGSQSAGGRD